MFLFPIVVELGILIYENVVKKKLTYQCIMDYGMSLL